MMTSVAAGTPVVRVWKGESDQLGADAYFQHVTMQVADELHRLPGFLGMTVWRRDVGATVEFVVTTRWQSMAAIESFAGADVTRAVVEPAARAVLTRFDDTATHYDVAFESAPRR
jgi:heme-degrading monooxygenase HmoA